MSNEKFLAWLDGYRIPFYEKPVQNHKPREQTWNIKEKLEISNLIIELLKKGATNECNEIKG